MTFFGALLAIPPGVAGAIGLWWFLEGRFHHAPMTERIAREVDSLPGIFTEPRKAIAKSFLLAAVDKRCAQLAEYLDSNAGRTLQSRRLAERIVSDLQLQALGGDTVRRDEMHLLLGRWFLRINNLLMARHYAAIVSASSEQSAKLLLAEIDDAIERARAHKEAQISR